MKSEDVLRLGSKGTYHEASTYLGDENPPPLPSPPLPSPWGLGE